MHLLIMLGLSFITLFSHCRKDEEIDKEIEIEEVISTTAFYVAPPTATPAGNDSNPGTYDKPWATWNKAFNSSSIQPGDTVYFRGGVYYHTQIEGGYGYDCSRNGEAGRSVSYFNYPGEVPILDCSKIIPSRNLNIPVTMRDIHYIHFKGLTIRNVWQADGEDEVVTWIVSGSNIILENCVVYNTHGIAFKADNCYDTYYINCDAFDNCDSLTTVPAENPMPGNDGSGFLNFNWDYSDASVYYKDCRAWNCGDQGFSSGSIAYTEYDGCWSFSNGQLEGGGHGFKLGWINPVDPIPLHRMYKNCIAAFNRHNGFATNDQGYECGAMSLFNNTAYHNGHYSNHDHAAFGFYIDNTADSDERELLRVFKNNISYDNETRDVFLGRDAAYSHYKNSWDTPPGVSVTDNDFLSLDSTGLSGPRKTDGSLPDINFLRLSSGSHLIDVGTSTTGLPYSGSAPDLGAYEFGN